MNAHLRSKMLAKLSNDLYERSSSAYSFEEQDGLARGGLIDCDDVAAVLEMIDGRVASLDAVWASVRRGMDRAKNNAAKDAILAEVLWDEIKWRWSRCDKERGRDFEAILKLLDQVSIDHD